MIPDEGRLVFFFFTNQKLKERESILNVKECRIKELLVFICVLVIYFWCVLCFIYYCEYSVCLRDSYRFLSSIKKINDKSGQK